MTGEAAPDSLAFSDQLEQWLSSESPKTVGDLGVVFAQKSFAVTILVLMIFPAVPLPTGGITHVFEAITVLLSLEMIGGLRSVWLPARVRDRDLGTATTEKVLPFLMKRVRWLERYSRPRAATLLSQRWFMRIIGLVFMAFALGAGLAPPFSGLDTIPAIGAVVVALGVVLEDLLTLIIGVVLGLAGILVSITVGTVLVHFVQGLF